MKTPTQNEIELYTDKTISKRKLINEDKHLFKYILVNSIKNEILGYSNNKEILFKNKLNCYDVAIRRALIILDNPFFI
jgi:hypothetical protein